MLSPHDEKYAQRLRELITEGKRLAKTERPSQYGIPYIQDDDAVSVQAWIAKLQNLLEGVFGRESSQVRHLQHVMPNGPGFVNHGNEVNGIVGLLIGSLDDLEHGFLSDREMLIVGEVFDSFLEQAKHLLGAGYKDVAAMLGRVVLEDALRRIAQAAKLDGTQKASKINDELKAKDRYSQPQWRQVQTWLDVGNAAAHGKFAEYLEPHVSAMLDGIANFVAIQLHR